MSYDITTKKDLLNYNKEVQNQADAKKINILNQNLNPEQFTKQIKTISLLKGYDISAHTTAVGSIDTRVSILYGGPESQASSIADSVFIDSLATNFWGGISI